MLKAYWTEDSPVTIDFLAGIGGTISPVGSVSVPPATGSVAPRTATVDTGYTFTSWTNSAGVVVSYNPTFTPLQQGGVWVADTYTANFAPLRITINFNANGGIPDTISPIQVDFGATYGSLPVVTRAGFAFSGWYTELSGGSVVSALTTLTDATTIQTLHAHWSRGIYPVIKHFDTYAGSGDDFALIDHDEYWEFTRLIYNDTGLEISPAQYSVSSGSTKITLAEVFMQRVPLGTHFFTAEFAYGASEPIMLTIQAPGDGSGSAGNAGGANSGLPGTGDRTYTLLLLAELLIFGAAAFFLYGRRRDGAASSQPVSPPVTAHAAS
jgi:uncharacterized repeat protein (TIGR02543 family)/LPXTG-motif cell wall-anchored protein